MKRLTLAGILLSLLWITAFVFLLYIKRATLSGLEVNEWGDFFAGAVAPLAFFWLVLGYIQQGEELRLNTEALKAQHNELQRQVAETALLAANSERQAVAAEQLALAIRNEAERTELKEIADAQPILKLNGGSRNMDNYSVNVLNSGATAFNVTVESDTAKSIRIAPSLQSGHTGTLQIEGVYDFPFTFTICYEDRLKVVRSKTYRMVSPFEFLEERDS